MALNHTSSEIVQIYNYSPPTKKKKQHLGIELIIYIYTSETSFNLVKRTTETSIEELGS